jgi:hypothetical protein
VSVTSRAGGGSRVGGRSGGCQRRRCRWPGGQVEADGLCRRAAGWRPEVVVSAAGRAGGGGQVGGWSAFWTETVPHGWDIFINFHGGFIASWKLTKRPLAVTCGPQKLTKLQSAPFCSWKLVNFRGFPSKPTEVK